MAFATTLMTREVLTHNIRLIGYRMNDQGGNSCSIEGNAYGAIYTVGGCSIAFCATAIRPHPMLKDKYGIDLDPYVGETIKDHDLKPLSGRHLGEAAQQIMQAARDEGFDWNPFLKFIDQDKCDLSTKCYYGCPSGGKWSARDYVEEAVAGSGRLPAACPSPFSLFRHCSPGIICSLACSPSWAG